MIRLAQMMFLILIILSPQLAFSQQQVTIAQWGQEKYLIYLPLYVAMEEGLFARHGIEVRLKYTGNDDQTYAAVIQGSAQLGVGDPIFAAIARERGLDSKVVGLLLGTVANWGVTNQKTMSAISKPSNLKDLRIGSFPAPSTTYTLLKEFLDVHKAEIGSAKIVQAPIGAQLALLEAGNADLVLELEPAVSIAEQQGYKVVYSSANFYGPYAFTGLNTTEENIRKYGDSIQAVVSGVQDALDLLRSDRHVGVRVARKLFPKLDAKVVEAAVNRMVTDSTFPKQVTVTDEAWQRALQTRLLVGDLKKPQPTSLTVDNSFAEQAVNEKTARKR